MVQKKILLIDDEKILADVMAKLLSRFGYNLTVTTSSTKALDILSRENFPLIITDLNMPEMDGTELCRRIRSFNSRSVIYALSGFVSDYDVEMFEEIGFDGHLCKPANARILREAIKGAFEKVESMDKQPLPVRGITEDAGRPH